MPFARRQANETFSGLAALLRPHLVLAALLALVVAPRFASAEALLLVEADSGRVLHAENATYPWYPASVTKLMTAYVTLKAVKDGRISLDTLYTVSPIASSQAPSKMGFKPGIQLTVDNALKMMMVKSANDMAVVLAEGLDGSIEGFAEEMNRTADRLGMTQTHYVNPNGLPADGHVTSARDLAILARAILRDLPEYEYFVHIPAIKFGRRVTRNFNSLIGRYPGADGMKTGFICASGFNLVASATHDGRRLIAVVLGSPSSSMRAYKAVQLLESGFSSGGLTWLTPSLGTVDQLQPVAAEPPNLRDDMCGPHRKRQQAPESDDDNAVSAGAGGGLSLFAGLQPGQVHAAEMLAAPASFAEPAIVYVGPKKTGPALIAANAAEADSQAAAAAAAAKGKGRKARLARGKPATDARPAATESAEGGTEKPAAKPKAAAAPKSGDKSGDKTRTAAVKPDQAAPKDASKDAAKAGSAKPAGTAAKPKPAAAADAKPAAHKKKDPATAPAAADGAGKS